MLSFYAISTAISRDCIAGLHRISGNPGVGGNDLKAGGGYL